MLATGTRFGPLHNDNTPEASVWRTPLGVSRSRRLVKTILMNNHPVAIPLCASKEHNTTPLCASWDDAMTAGRLQPPTLVTIQQIFLANSIMDASSMFATNKVVPERLTLAQLPVTRLKCPDDSSKDKLDAEY